MLFALFAHGGMFTDTLFNTPSTGAEKQGAGILFVYAPVLPFCPFLRLPADPRLPNNLSDAPWQYFCDPEQILQRESGTFLGVMSFMLQTLHSSDEWCMCIAGQVTRFCYWRETVSTMTKLGDYRAAMWRQETGPSVTPHPARPKRSSEASRSTKSSQKSRPGLSHHSAKTSLFFRPCHSCLIREASLVTRMHLRRARTVMYMP
jgi:hypothetical protein